MREVLAAGLCAAALAGQQPTYMGLTAQQLLTQPLPERASPLMPNPGAWLATPDRVRAVAQLTGGTDDEAQGLAFLTRHGRADFEAIWCLGYFGPHGHARLRQLADSTADRSAVARGFVELGPVALEDLLEIHVPPTPAGPAGPGEVLDVMPWAKPDLIATLLERARTPDGGGALALSCLARSLDSPAEAAEMPVSRVLAAPRRESPVGQAIGATKLLPTQRQLSPESLSFLEDLARTVESPDSRLRLAVELLQHDRPSAAIDLIGGNEEILTDDDLQLLIWSCRRGTPLGDAARRLREQLEQYRNVAQPGFFDPHARRRTLATRLLGTAGLEHLDLLLQMIDSDKKGVRACGYAGLGEVARARAEGRGLIVDMLAKGAADLHRGFPHATSLDHERTLFVRGLALGGPKLAGMLAGLLRADGAQPTAIVLETLLWMGRDAAPALPALLALLEHPDPAIAGGAFQVAAAIAPEMPLGADALPGVIDRIRSAAEPSRQLQIDVLRLMLRHGPAMLEAAVAARPAVRLQVLQLMTPPEPLIPGAEAPRRPTLDPSVLDVFTRAADPRIRLAAIRGIALQPLRDADLRLLVRVALEDPRWDLRAHAIRLLSELEPTHQAMAALGPAFADPDRFVRDSALDLLRLWRHRLVGRTPTPWETSRFCGR